MGPTLNENIKDLLKKDKDGAYDFIKIKHGKPEETPGKISTRKYVKNLEEELILIDLNIEKEKIKKAEKLVEYRNFKEIHCLVCGVFLYHSGIGRFPKYCEKHRKEKRKELHSNWKKKNPIY